jgi:dihydroorotate dehydrogenase electron transfer subunit
MNVAVARVVENQQLYGNTFICWFSAPELCRAASPGQFVMLRCVESPTYGEARPTLSSLPSDPLLPRAMSIHRVRSGASGLEWSVLFEVVGRGTAWLASRVPGDLVLAWGPLGHGFDRPATSRHLLLIGGGVGVAPLVWLADEAVQSGAEVVLVLGGRTASQIYPAPLLPPQVEVVVMTEDGSLGRQGVATAAFSEYLDWCDEALACGPNAMFSAMNALVRERRSRKSVQILLEERMGCGTGICYGCTVETRRGPRLVCKDGPRFRLHELSV